MFKVYLPKYTHTHIFIYIYIYRERESLVSAVCIDDGVESALTVAAVVVLGRKQSDLNAEADIF